MADTYSPRLKLPFPAPGQQLWNVENDARATIVDGVNACGALAVTAHDTPVSTSLTVDVTAGSFVSQDGGVVTFAGTTSFAVAASGVYYLYLDGTSAWALTSAVAFPTSTPHVRLAVVTTGATTVTSVVDARIVAAVVSGLVRPALATATAGATFTSVEQGMLNVVYAAVKALMK